MLTTYVPHVSAMIHAGAVVSWIAEMDEMKVSSILPLRKRGSSSLRGLTLYVQSGENTRR